MYDTIVKLMRIDLSDEHQLTFNSLQAQTTFFENLNGLVVTDFSYQRKDNIIRYPGLIDNIKQYNYVRYDNVLYDPGSEFNKYYYAYITEMKYINDNMTEIHITTDVFQTWQFDIIYRKTFIEREHVNSDNVGEHTIHEGLETGEYVINTFEYTDELSELCYIVQATEDMYNQAFYSTNMGGIPMAGGAYVCKDSLTLQNLISQYNSGVQGAPTIDAIVNVWAVPKSIVLNFDWTKVLTIPSDIEWEGQDYPESILHSISKPTNLNGYTPKNKKLLTYPYCYLCVDNNNGMSNILHYEQFKTSDCKFMIYGVPYPGASIKIIPENYDVSLASIENEGIFAGKYPTMSWSKDNYTNWLTLNGLNLNVGIAQDIASIGGSMINAGMGVGGGGIVSSAFSIFSKMASIIEHARVPNSAVGNTNGGDLNVCNGANGFFFYKYSIKSEFAEIIDNFFSMYGYKVNDVKYPNITGRTNWNYVKTIDFNFDSNVIPNDDMQKIKEIFDSGITFWHNYNTFRDYSQSNNIV